MMELERIIAIILFIVFLFTFDLEYLKVCGIFSIASYLEMIRDEINRKV